jgi:hypothetical protein
MLVGLAAAGLSISGVRTAALGRLGRGLGGLLLRGGLPAADRLVERRQRLVEHVDGRLRQQREQDRLPAFRVAPLQRLPGRSAAHAGREPARLCRQRRQVYGVRVEAPQVGRLLREPLADCGLSRRGG